MLDTLYSTPVFRRHHGFRMFDLLRIGFAVALIVVATGLTSRGMAQTPGAQTGGAATEKQITALFYELDDIDWLKSLAPLKLTVDELDKLIAAMTSAKEAYDKQWIELALTYLKPITAEIHDVKRRALTGGDVPDDFYNRAKKASSGFAEARAKLDLQTLGLVAPIVHEILTPVQIATASKMSRNQASLDGKPTTGTDTQWFNKYVQSVILSHPRIVALLKEMRDAADPGTAGKKAEARPSSTQPVRIATGGGIGR